MDIQQILLVGLIAVNTIVSIIASLTGNKDVATKAEEKRLKALNKLQKKHNQTEKKFIEEESKIKQLSKE